MAFTTIVESTDSLSEYVHSSLVDIKTVHRMLLTFLHLISVRLVLKDISICFEVVLGRP